MRAAVITALTGRDAVEVRDVPELVPQRGQVLIDVAFAGVVFPDVSEQRTSGGWREARFGTRRAPSAGPVARGSTVARPVSDAERPPARRAGTMVRGHRLSWRPAQRSRLLAHSVAAGDHEPVEVVVAVGGWEHACCGPAIERDELVDLSCLHVLAPDGEVDLSETHHDLEPDVRVQGRVRDIQVARLGQPAQPVLRLPSGKALPGFDDEDDGRLEEDPWTGELLPDGDDFLLIVDVG